MHAADELVDRARAGDRAAFDDLVGPYRSELRRHCYRLLGNPHDAEDAVQETLLAAWHGLPGFEGRASVRTWLYRIATHRCLNAARSSARRPPLAPRAPFPVPEPSRRDDATWLRPCPDGWLGLAADAAVEERESVEVAFVAALQALTPRQAATLVLRDVLGLDLTETAAALDVSPTVAKGLLQRARAGLRRRVPRGAAPPSPGSAEERRVARRFAAAFVADDVDAVLALLTDDAWLAMPPAPHVYTGRRAVRAFLVGHAAHRDAIGAPTLVPLRANGQPAFAWYLRRGAAARAEAAGLVVLTLRGDRVAGCTRFLGDDLPAAFGLPAEVAPG